MQEFDIIEERDLETGLYVGYVPGWPGAHSQGIDIDEARLNLEEVAQLLLEDGESEFVGIQRIRVA